ncbi:MFS transporter [Patescibacteria group bacterium]|nr:MFS transporter [Patescibacteria group bacterium]MBU2035985.1 MFS transporter [Patescibacteria group bacterium]
MNTKVKLLTLLDVFSLYGINLLSPIFSVFVIEKIDNGNLKIVGIALAINLLVGQLFSLVMARYFDKTKGNADEYKYLFFGYAVISFLPIFYIWATSIWHIYLLQFIGGIMVAISYPAWRGLYSRNIDRGKEAFEWSFNASANGLKAATAAILSGYIADTFGFNYVFMIAPVMGIIGIIALIKIRKYFLKSSA